MELFSQKSVSVCNPIMVIIPPEEKLRGAPLQSDGHDANIHTGFIFSAGRLGLLLRRAGAGGG